jgi:hypothetical protein
VLFVPVRPMRRRLANRRPLSVVCGIKRERERGAPDACGSFVSTAVDGITSDASFLNVRSANRPNPIAHFYKGQTKKLILPGAPGRPFTPLHCSLSKPLAGRLFSALVS